MKKIGKTFLSLGLGFIIGIFIASIGGQRGLFLVLVIITLTILGIVKKKYRCWLILAVGLLLGIARYSLMPLIDVSQYDGQKVNLSGYVCEEPDLRGIKQKITLCTEAVNILITTDLYPTYQYGDELEMAGRVQVPGTIENFAYDRYLARYGIYLVSYSPSLQRVGENMSLSVRFYRQLFAFKLSLKEIIGRGLKEPESGLANALILGYKRTVSDDYLQKFSVIGLSHMIAISGTHITILAAIIMDFLLFFNLSRRRAFYFTIIFLIFYVVLTGNQASAVRSLIMGAIGLAAKEWGREFKFVNGLIVAGTGMLLINPRLLRDDLGFQLSFLAIMALIYIYPLFNVYAAKWLCNFKGKIFWRHKLKYILDILSVTIACQIISSPLLAINFNQVSVIAPLANLIILWVFDFLMVALLGALALSWFLPGLSIIFFLPSLWMLKYIYLMTNFLAQCPLAAVAVNNFGWIGVGLYYLILGLVVWWLNKQKTRGN